MRENVLEVYIYTFLKQYEDLIEIKYVESLHTDCETIENSMPVLPIIVVIVL